MKPKMKGKPVKSSKPIMGIGSMPDAAFAAKPVAKKPAPKQAVKKAGSKRGY